MASDVLRLTVCRNHVAGVAVWYVSPDVSLDISCHMMVLTLFSKFCGEVSANLNALNENSFVKDNMSDGMFHAG